MIYPEVKHSIAFDSIPGQDELSIVLIDNFCSLLMWKTLFSCLDTSDDTDVGILNL